jgi:hypothetical protein
MAEPIFINPGRGPVAVSDPRRSIIQIDAIRHKAQDANGYGRYEVTGEHYRQFVATGALMLKEDWERTFRKGAPAAVLPAAPVVAPAPVPAPRPAAAGMDTLDPVVHTGVRTTPPAAKLEADPQAPAVVPPSPDRPADPNFGLGDLAPADTTAPAPTTPEKKKAGVGGRLAALRGKKG